MVTGISGLPLIEQQTRSLTVSVAVATASVLGANDVDQETCSSSWSYTFMVGSGTAESPANLEVAYTYNTPGTTELTLGELFLTSKY